jgi:rubrerythrin
MLEYILFDEKLFQLFIDWLKKHNVDYETRVDEENYEIMVSEDLDEDLQDEIDEKYEELMDMNQDMINEAEKESNDGYHMAGVIVTLKDGTISYADVDSRLLAKVVSVITPEEFAQIVTAIADAVENPQPKTFCQRMREK